MEKIKRYHRRAFSIRILGYSASDIRCVRMPEATNPRKFIRTIWTLPTYTQLETISHHSKIDRKKTNTLSSGKDVAATRDLAKQFLKKLEAFPTLQIWGYARKCSRSATWKKKALVGRGDLRLKFKPSSATEYEHNQNILWKSYVTSMNIDEHL